jgi:hypothetical protein
MEIRYCEKCGMELKPAPAHVVYLPWIHFWLEKNSARDVLTTTISCGIVLTKQ